MMNNIYRSSVPAEKYLPERRSAAFRHQYTPACSVFSYYSWGLAWH